ncbi:MucB/RseB-like sigma(E) regulatory protein [Sulfuritortus calidifontis]|uniref:MucB/RseB-like sigma(E) regulatory protein n=1 Tax=Sulfuritortus calidifontis TaxID=1914471 RepID=A0A4R3JT30_9PROT|nr:MucB/RseB C-terminal domain-containing protein [Sulfuritortus calidifontis]TCS70432.1 MucB/RseB-like sigma(E) regulatory protein [Sulfuritortus calidifontis]
MRQGWIGLVCLVAGQVWAAPDPADWLQNVAEAPRRLSYEGVFVFQHGDTMQTVQIVNRPAGSGKESRLTLLDGVPREVLCSKAESISLSTSDGQTKLERRLNSRHFPDLLPAQAERLLAWYELKPGKMARVAGLDCRQLELVPKDRYRWGYVLCAEKGTDLPLKAVMVNERGQPLMQYAFTEVQIGRAREPAMPKLSAKAMAEAPAQASGDTLRLKQLPPGFVRVAAVKRKLPQHAEATEHWVFSDGLTHISLFIEPMARMPQSPVKGESRRGMLNMMVRQVGQHQVTVLGEAPWPAIEAVAMAVEDR